MPRCAAAAAAPVPRGAGAAGPHVAVPPTQPIECSRFRAPRCAVYSCTPSPHCRPMIHIVTPQVSPPDHARRLTCARAVPEPYR
eukprot:2312695-Prymnesium_polylepis.1